MKASGRTALRRVPPVLTGVLFVTWLLLNETLSPGHVVLALIFAVALAWASGVLRPAQPRLRRMRRAAALLGFVLLDIVRSNLGVALIVLGLVRNRTVHPGFVKVPLALQDAHGLAVLAGIVTATPGTVWVDYDVATSTLTLHVLDLQSEKQWIDWIKQRYEQPLMEIFE